MSDRVAGLGGWLFALNPPEMEAATPRTSCRVIPAAGSDKAPTSDNEDRDKLGRVSLRDRQLVLLLLPASFPDVHAQGEPLDLLLF